MFKDDDDIAFFKNHEINFTPVYDLVKISKTESDRESLKRSFDLVHDNFDGSWLCRALRYYDVLIDFESFDRRLQEKYLKAEEFGLTVDFKGEEIFVKNFRVVDLQFVVSNSEIKFSGQLKGRIDAHT